MKIEILIGILFIGFLSCDPGVVFVEASPPSVPSIDEIPEGFIGNYLCESDSTIMRIHKRVVLHESVYDIITTLDKVYESENCSIVDGGLHISGRKECFPFDYLSEDSITARIYLVDTLFSFQSGEVAKYYKGQLFINVLNEHNNWVTWTLRPDNNGNLEFFLIKVPVKKSAVEEITENYETRELARDKIQYIIKPSLIEFDEILKKDYAMLCETLLPINAEIIYPLPFNDL